VNAPFDEKMTMKTRFILVATTFCLATSAFATTSIEVTASNVVVLDGDTIELFIQGEKRPVHLSDVDAPELDQPGGIAAKQHLDDLLKGKVIIAMVVPYNNGLIAVIRFDRRDSETINMNLVRTGWAWALGNGYKPLQAEAQKLRKGLWAEPAPVPPWAWRKNRRASNQVPENIGTNALNSQH